MNVLRWFLVAMAITLGGTLPVTGEEAGSVSDLTVDRSGDTVTVAGSATFGDATNAQVGSDAGDDAAIAGIGGEMTEARIRRLGDTLRFTLAIADPIEEIFTLPEFTHYHWQITVTNGEQTVNYLLQAMRSGQYDRVLPSADPLFRVNACGNLSSGAPNCFDHLAYVDGTMAGGIVEWEVPLDVIRALDGAVVAEGERGVRVIGGASGAAYGTPVIDQISTTPFVVGPAVLVSILRSTGSATTSEVATLGPDGTFVAKLEAPRSGSGHTVQVRACDGHAPACAEVLVPLPN